MIGTVGIVDQIEIRIEAIDRLGQHRVAEAINGVRELRNDRRIDSCVVPKRRKEFVDVRLHSARKFLKHQMLILHLRAEAPSLE